MIYDSILNTIGRTPIVRVNRIAPKHVDLYVKCEFFNPLSSVKDRLAIAIIEDAEQRGELKPGQTVVEATSGNTGIALAMVCAAKGYPFVAVMVETFSVERRKIMRMLGAKVILTPAAASLLAGAEFKPHKVQGWTPDFVPKVLNRSVPHEIVPVTDDESIAAARSLARNEGIFCGISSGGTFAAAVKVAEKAAPGSVIVAMLPDTGERYLSTPLFEGIAEGSDPEP
jgi:cysteine synthase A